MRPDLAPGYDRDDRGAAPPPRPELWREFVRTSGVVPAVAESTSPAEALLWVALAGQGAQLAAGAVVHEGRRLAVVVGDSGPPDAYVVPPARCLRSPVQAAIDVLVACRERGVPAPWWEEEGAVPEAAPPAPSLDFISLPGPPANEVP